MQGWTSHIPISDRLSSPSPPSTASSINLTLGLPRRNDAVPAPLPTPNTTSPRPPTPVQDESIGHEGGPGVLSPPTPAPSPGPKDGWRREKLGDSMDLEEVEQDTQVGNNMEMDIDETAGEKGKGKVSETSEAADLVQLFKALNAKSRNAFLASLIGELSMAEALSVTRKIEPRLRRDFLRQLPTELALHCLSFVEDARTLARASQVSRYWNGLLQDENTWKEMCDKHHFTAIVSPITYPRDNAYTPARRASTTNALLGPDRRSRNSKGSTLDKDKPLPRISEPTASFRQRFKTAYQTESNWLQGGRVLAAHTSQTDAVVTSLAIDANFLVIGMADGPIHVFDSQTGAFKRSLGGHLNGVWTLAIVSAATSADLSVPESPRDGRPTYARAAKSSRGPYRDSGRRSSFNTDGNASSGGRYQQPNSALGIASADAPSVDEAGDGRPMMGDPCNAARGWGNKRPLIVSGGCDRIIRVWDLLSGTCLQTLRGHTSTVRCIKVLDRRPIVVSGSRDGTLRVWDISTGQHLRTLSGHEQSVRCMEVAGNKVVSGSYDYSCRIWDVDTGECLKVLRGHYHQIYCVAFDGKRVVSGSLDSSVRVWDAETGECTTMLQGHTSLVGQLQLSGDYLVTGGSDGRVITFDLKDGSCVHRLCAHDNSVTCLQFDDRFIISGGNDGRVKLWDFRTGQFIRELSKPGEAVWRVAFRDDQCAVLLQRQTRTILEVITFKPTGTV